MDLTYNSNLNSSEAAQLFADGGQMGELMRTYAWDKHPLGNPQGWPLSLKTGIRMMLRSKHPMFIWWSNHLYMFHNDAYVPLMGEKHPQGLGAKGNEAWAEIWPQLGAVLEGILAGEEAFYGKELEVPMNRKGFMEEAYWTFSYSGMPDDEGKVNGIFCACNEVTETVLARRRLQTIKDLSQSMIEQTTFPTACEKIGQVLERNSADIPFSLLYILDDTGREAQLMAQSGDLSQTLAPARISLSQPETESPWVLSQVYKHGQAVVVDLHRQSVSADVLPERAIILPITKAGQSPLQGFLVAGLSQRLEYDEFYQSFHQMLVGQIVTALSTVYARQQAEQQRERLYSLFMQAPAPICILDGENLVYELVNPSYQQLFPGRELLGKPILKALPEIATNTVWQTFQQVYQTGRTHEETEMLIPIINPVSQALEDRYFRYIQQPRFTLAGIPDGIVVFAFEITEQVHARQVVEKNARQLKLLTDALPVLIGYLDREEKYRFANQAYETWFNYKPEELLGRTVREIVGEAAYAQAEGYIGRALAGERLDFESQMDSRKDFLKYIRTSYVPDTREGEVVGFYTLVLDITEQVVARQQIEEREKEAQLLAQELAASNEELQAANEEIQSNNDALTTTIEELAKTNQQLSYVNSDMDNFIYTASHDLKAPISNIEGLMTILKRQLSADSLQIELVQKPLSLIETSILRFKKTIGDLTNITQLQRESNPEITQVSLWEVVEDVRLDLENSLTETQARVEIDVQGCPTIRFSKKNLRSIVYNLFSNALKYRAQERTPVIGIHCERAAPYTILTVSDNGLGMDLSKETKIFAMFGRLHNHVEGSGVGLYMVKKILENAGGQIKVDSQVGIGSTFRVYFPT